MHDTFYLKNLSKMESKHVLRTHTSPVQIRGMLENEPPLAFVSGGKGERFTGRMMIQLIYQCFIKLKEL